MKILLTGGTGQVGRALQSALSPMGNVFTPGREALDLADREAVASYVASQQPELIVNAAAYTAVDAAENDVEMAMRVNRDLPGCLARLAAERDIGLIHYSTDYVYSGDGESPWLETSETEPLSVYGRTKLAGDLAIADSGARHLIFRTSWVYDAFGANFMTTMLRLGRERKALSVVDDQIGAPTPASLIATVTLLALRQWQADQLESGVYHLAPRGVTSWCGFAREIFDLAEHMDAKVGSGSAFKPPVVRAITTAAYPTPAARPLNSRLALNKLENALGIVLPDWRSQLQLIMDERKRGERIDA